MQHKHYKHKKSVKMRTVEKKLGITELATNSYCNKKSKNVANAGYINFFLKIVLSYDLEPCEIFHLLQFSTDCFRRGRNSATSTG